MSKTKILFETYLCTVKLSQDTFMLDYQNSVLPLLESKNVKSMHFKLKECARASELTVLPNANYVLDKLRNKAKLVLESNKFELVDRMYSIGCKHPKASAITAAMITTAIAEGANSQYVLVPGMKVLHRAFLSEADLPNDYEFGTAAGTRYKKTADGWMNLNNNRPVDPNAIGHVTGLAKEAYELEQSSIPEKEEDIPEVENAVESSDNTEETAVVPVGYTMVAEDDSVWEFNGTRWFNRDSGHVIEDDEVNQSIIDVALASIAQESDDDEDDDETPETFDVEETEEDFSDEDYDNIEDVTDDVDETPEINTEEAKEADEELEGLDFSEDDVEEPEIEATTDEPEVVEPQSDDSDVDLEPEVKEEPAKAKKHKLPKSVDSIPRGYEFTAPNGTELKWLGAMWAYKNSNGKFVPVPKKHKASVIKLLQQNIDAAAKQKEEADRVAQEEKKKAEELKQSELSSKFDFGLDDEPEVQDEPEEDVEDDIDFDEPSVPEERESDQIFPIGYAITSNAGTEFEYLGDGVWGNNTTGSYVENTNLADKITKAAIDRVEQQQAEDAAEERRRAEEEHAYKQAEVDSEDFSDVPEEPEDVTNVVSEPEAPTYKNTDFSPAYQRPTADNMDANDPGARYRNKPKDQESVNTTREPSPTSRAESRSSAEPASKKALHPDLISVLDDIIAQGAINNRNT